MAKGNVITKFKTEGTEGYNRKVQQSSDVLHRFGLGGKETGSMIGQLDKALGTSIGSFGKLSLAVGATSAAIKVAKDAFFAMESNIDEWGRTVEGAKGAYQTFLDTLNNGNWSGFFSNLNDAINGSRELYDKLDRLGSIQANNSAAIALEQQTLSQARVKLQEAKNKGDKQHIKQLQDEVKIHEKRLAELRGQEVQAGKEAGMQEITNRLMSSANTTMRGAMNRKTAELIANDLLRNGQAAFDKYAKNYDYYQRLGTRKVERVDMDGNRYYSSSFDINRLNPTQRKQYAAAKAVTETETDIQEGIKTYTNAVNTQTQSDSEQYRYNRMAGYGSGAGSGRGRSPKEDLLANVKIHFVPSNVRADKAIFDAMNKESENALSLTASLGMPTKADIMGDMANKGDMEGRAIGDMYAEWQRLEKYKPADLAKAGNVTAEAWQSAASAIGNVGDALQALGSPAASVLGIIAEAIANVALAASSAMKAKDTTASGWAWIGAAAAITGTMVSTIDAIKSATEYHAGGGLVGANGMFQPRGTDTIPAMLTPQEVVLNASQANNVAAKLQQNNSENNQGQPFLQAETIWLGIGNHLKRSGQGEIITTRNINKYI